jgi:putative transposase
MLSVADERLLILMLPAEVFAMGFLQKARRSSYPSDVTDEQWAIIRPLLEEPKATGRPWKYTTREMLNAMFYLIMTGCQWRALPHDLPPWTSVYKRFRQWTDEGRIKAVQDALRGQARRACDRDEHPSAGSIDSQSVKASQKGAVARAAMTLARKSKAENAI